MSYMNITLVLCAACINTLIAQTPAQKGTTESKSPRPSQAQLPENAPKYIEEGLPASDKLLFERIKKATRPEKPGEAALYGEVDFNRLLMDGEFSDNERRQLTGLEDKLGKATELRNSLIETAQLVKRLQNRLATKKLDADGTNPEREVNDLITKMTEAKKQYEPLKERIRTSIQQINGSLAN